jgi:hypothetical protein
MAYFLTRIFIVSSVWYVHTPYVSACKYIYYDLILLVFWIYFNDFSREGFLIIIQDFYWLFFFSN